jgi:ferredoxin-fold anticodon binding domain-containing protein
MLKLSVYTLEQYSTEICYKAIYSTLFHFIVVNKVCAQHIILLRTKYGWVWETSIL